MLLLLYGWNKKRIFDVLENAFDMNGSDLKGKAVVFLGDGMADLPIPELGGKTPLEAVETPCMDRIAQEGSSGTFLTLPDGYPTSSDVANMSVLGYAPSLYYPGRGPIEAVSQGIRLADDDVAFRCNLTTVGNGEMLDYSAGHISKEHAARLIADLQKEFGSDEATFHPGVSYRNLLILHGKSFSPRVSYAKPDSSHGMKLEELWWKPLDESPEAVRTANFLRDLFERTKLFLENHPLVKSGEAKANSIWPWSPGRTPSFPAFSDRYPGKTGAVITAVDVISGIAKCAGMDVIPVPGATGYIDTNYEGKAAAAIRAIEDHDFVYVHLEAIDETGHEGRLDLKMQAIADFERRIVKPVFDALHERGCTFAVLPDHPVPISLRQHTRTPVPVAICGPAIPRDAVLRYSEKDAPHGALGRMTGDELIRLILGL